MSWVLVQRHSREELSLHAALEQFWIHSNAGSIVSFAVSFSSTRDFTVLLTWIFSRLIQKSLSCITWNVSFKFAVAAAQFVAILYTVRQMAMSEWQRPSQAFLFPPRW